MKKIILASVMVVAATASINANAAVSSICSGAATNAVSVTSANDGTAFVRQGFQPRCSNNVHLFGDDAATYYRVGAASAKGKQRFGGSSLGGAISGTNCPAATGCTSSDASTALQAASSGS